MVPHRGGPERNQVGEFTPIPPVADRTCFISRYRPETFLLSNRYCTVAKVPIAQPADVNAVEVAADLPNTEAAARWGPAAARKAHDVLLPLGMIVVISLAPFVGYNPRHPGGQLVLAGLVVLTAAAALTRHGRTFRLGLALTVTIAAFGLPWEVNWWPLPGAVGMTAYVLAGLVGKNRTDPMVHLRVGRLSRIDGVAIAALAVVSTLFLLAFRAMNPGHMFLGDELLARIPPWLLGVAGVGFAAGNAAVEELLFRGAILHHLRGIFGAWPAIIVQAIAFGLLHLHGYPYGAIGVAMATVYGLILGAIRLRSRGLLAPWVAHVVADSVIFVIILKAASRGS
jgi:membrane protease YdiL (CAAX protease family)